MGQKKQRITFEQAQVNAGVKPKTVHTKSRIEGEIQKIYAEENRGSGYKDTSGHKAYSKDKGGRAGHLGVYAKGGRRGYQTDIAKYEATKNPPTPPKKKKK